MTQLEKSNLKSTTVAIIIVTLMGSFTTGLTAFFSTKHGIEKAVDSVRSDFQLEIKDVKSEFNDKLNLVSNKTDLLKKDVDANTKRVDRMEEAASTYLAKSPQQSRNNGYN